VGHPPGSLNPRGCLLGLAQCPQRVSAGRLGGRSFVPAAADELREQRDEARHHDSAICAQARAFEREKMTGASATSRRGEGGILRARDATSECHRCGESQGADGCDSVVARLDVGAIHRPRLVL